MNMLDQLKELLQLAKSAHDAAVESGDQECQLKAWQVEHKIDEIIDMWEANFAGN
jgi:hypothetical protein